MSLIRWKPTQELMPLPTDVLNIQRSINRMFDSFFREGFLDEDLSSTVWNPAVDLAERDQEYVVKVELPGVNKDDVRITTRGNMLTIRGEKKQESERKDSSFHRVERAYGSFQRTFELPGSVKNDRIEATFNDGILEVILPKADEAKTKTIEVKVK